MRSMGNDMFEYQGRIVALAPGSYTPGDDDSIQSAIEAVITDADNPPGVDEIRSIKKERVKTLSSRKVQAAHSQNEQIELIAIATVVLNKARKGGISAQEEATIDALQAEFESNILPILQRRDQLLSDLDASGDPDSVDILRGW